MTAGAVAGSAAVTAACIAAGLSSVSAPAGIATSAGAIATAASTVVAATSAATPATAISTTAITVSQRRLGVQRLVIKQRKWRGCQCRASEQCKDKLMEGAKLHHDASSWLVHNREYSPSRKKTAEIGRQIHR